MGFFDKLFGSSDNSKDNDTVFELTTRAKARQIVLILGERVSVRSYGRGGYSYNSDYHYRGYGFEIALIDPKNTTGETFYINYNKQRVYDSRTYVKGPWEEVLNELYNSISAISREKDKAKALEEKKLNINNILKDITKKTKTIRITNNLKVESYECLGGYNEDTYEGTWYRVWQDRDVVFDGHYFVSRANDCRTYKPGPWEEKIKKYAADAKQENQRREKQAKQTEAKQRIKEIRKLRGE